jgi:hypothetical protein
MHDLFHVHGAGRFVFFALDGLPEANVWKDTVLSAVLSFDVLPTNAA